MKMKFLICLIFVILLVQIKSEESITSEEKNETQSDSATSPEGVEDVMKLLEGEEFNKNFETVQPDMSQEREELERAVNQTVKQMGLDKNETMDRATFRKLFTKVVLQDEELPESEMNLFDKLIEKVINNAPETFPTSEVNKYIDIQFITSQLNDIMTEEGYDPNQMMGGMEDAEEDVHPDDTPKVDL